MDDKLFVNAAGQANLLLLSTVLRFQFALQFEFHASNLSLLKEFKP
jgi:hypothetical protein